VNSAGGVGSLGTYGDVSKARVEANRWKRVVISVKCVKGGNKNTKGELRTWVDAVPCSVVKHDSIVQEGRFSLDPASLYLFSSSSPNMMPGNIAVRTVRVQAGCVSGAEVKRDRAKDKIISMFNEERIAEVDLQRKGLALSNLFAKPRPVWLAPALVATFGDAFIEGTRLEGSSLLAWSFTVLNECLQRCLLEQSLFFERFTSEKRGCVSDTLFVLNKSIPVFKQMLKLLKQSNDSQLASFLKRIRKLLQAVDVGDSLLLPVLVQSQEILLLIQRVSERQFTFVVVQSDPKGGLRHHPVSPEFYPKLKSCT
jgi:hypothetical protein